MARVNAFQREEGGRGSVTPPGAQSKQRQEPRVEHAPARKKFTDLTRCVQELVERHVSPSSRAFLIAIPTVDQYTFNRLRWGPLSPPGPVLPLSHGAEARIRGRKLGAQPLADRLPEFDSPIVAARFEGRDASDLARRLKERRVVVSARHGNLRVSAHFYNTEADLDRLETELRALL